MAQKASKHNNDSAGGIRSQEGCSAHRDWKGDFSCSFWLCLSLPHSLSFQNSPLLWKASLRLSSTSANHRTSFTNCITYSGSTPGAPVSVDVNPMLLKGLRFLELRPISKVWVDPADTDLAWGLKMCCGRPWVCFVSSPPLLLLLFRSIPAASAGATLYRWYSRLLNLWTHHTAMAPGPLQDRKVGGEDEVFMFLVELLCKHQWSQALKRVWI